MSPLPSLLEANLDSLVGPTHHYAGLSPGNLASTAHRAQPSSPRTAALQGIAKMRLLHKLGIPQLVAPPHPRPDVAFLRRLGFTGHPAQILEAAARAAPGLLSIASSSSFMWAANAATVSPAADTPDGTLHFTPANLAANLHRSLEPAFTARLLRHIFPDAAYFTHHSPLPAHPAFGDEGAANHTRFHAPGQNDTPGTHLFVYGRNSERDTVSSARYPARHSRLASEAVARRHGLDPAHTVFAQQSPAAIGAGVFHNDVISVGNRDVFLCHAQAFVEQEAVFRALQNALPALHILTIHPDELSLEDAVSTYLFNSQLVTLPDGGMALILPAECETHPKAQAVVTRLLEEDALITDACYVNLRQSMENGGGPACLRLRVPLTEAAWRATHAGVKASAALFDALEECVRTHYRDRLTLDDLRDPALAEESFRCLHAIAVLLGMETLYDDVC